MQLRATKTIKGKEHLSWQQRVGELWLFTLEQGNPVHNVYLPNGVGEFRRKNTSVTPAVCNARTDDMDSPILILSLQLDIY